MILVAFLKKEQKGIILTDGKQVNQSPGNAERPDEKIYGEGTGCIRNHKRNDSGRNHSACIRNRERSYRFQNPGRSEPGCRFAGKNIFILWLYKKGLLFLQRKKIKCLV